MADGNATQDARSSVVMNKVEAAMTRLVKPMLLRRSAITCSLRHNETTSVDCRGCTARIVRLSRRAETIASLICGKLGANDDPAW